LHEWVGSVDINSLYPNVIRSLNISPETIIGQFSNYIEEHDWMQIKNRTDERITLILESGEQVIKTAAEWSDELKENKWAVSAYGTVFDQSRGRGVIPDILGYWYTERKRLQAEKKKWGKEVKSLRQSLGIDISHLVKEVEKSEKEDTKSIFNDEDGIPNL
jgi:DNA polymerase elongation subunit (family B)